MGVNGSAGDQKQIELIHPFLPKKKKKKDRMYTLLYHNTSPDNSSLINEII